MFHQILKSAGIYDEMDVLARAQFLEGFLRIRPFGKIRSAIGKTQLLSRISEMTTEAGAVNPAWTSKMDTGLYKSVLGAVRKALRSSQERSTTAEDVLQSMMGLMGWEDESGETVELGGKSPFWQAGRYASDKGDWLSGGNGPMDATNLAVRLAYRRALDVIRTDASRARKQKENLDTIIDETMSGGESESDWGMVIDSVFANPDHPLSQKFFDWLDRKIGAVLPPAAASTMGKYLELLRSGQVQFKGTGQSGAGGGDTAAANLLGITPQALWKVKNLFSEKMSSYLTSNPGEREKVQDMFADATFMRDLFRGQMHTARSRRVATAFLMRLRTAEKGRDLVTQIASRWMARSASRIEERATKEWTRLAKEPVEVEEKGGALYGFGSELAVLRLLRAFHPKGRVGFSTNLNRWYFVTNG